jgi:modulator of FtsH protease
MNETLAHASIAPAARHQVLRDTYRLLALTMIPTIAGAWLGSKVSFAFAAGSPIMFSLGVLAAMFGMFWLISQNRNSGVGVALLLALTGAMGFLLGPMLQAALGFSNGSQLIGMAAAGTGAIFFTLSAVATTSKRDFSSMGQFLMVGAVVLILAMVANLFFQIPALSLALSAFAVLLFSAFILYDVSRIVNGGETNYIMATLAIYLDIYNVFSHLLRLLMTFAGERD